MKNKYALYAMALGNFAVGIGSLVVAGVLQPLADDFNVSLNAIGQLITVYALVYAISSPLLIAFTGQLDRQCLLIIGLILAALGNGLAAISPTYSIMLIARIITALGAAIFTPVASTLAALISEPSDRGKAIALVFAGFTAATALGIPLGTYVGLTFGWRITFGLVAFLAGTAVFAIVAQVPTKVEAPPVDLSAFWKVLKNSTLLMILIVTLIQLAAQLTLFTFITPYVQSRTDLGTIGVTILFLTNGVSGFFGNLWGGNLSDRIGARKTILIFLLLLIVAFVMMPLIENWLWVGFLASGLWGLVGLGFNAPQQTRLVTLAPPLASAILGLNASFLYLGISLGSTLGGFSVRQLSLDSLPWVAVCLTAACLLVFAASYWAEEKLIA